VDEQLRGAAVQCGGCGNPFSVPAPASWWGGLRRVVRSLTGTPKSEPTFDPTVNLDLDGPDAQAQPATEREPDSLVLPRFDVGVATSAGKVRPHNEDSYLLLHWGWCNRDAPGDTAALAVADGMGGHAGGDVASGLVIRSLAGSLGGLSVRLAQAESGQPTPSTAEVAASVGEAIQAAHRVTSQKAGTESAHQGMGATLAVVVAWRNSAVVAHVGDCRVYRWQRAALSQLTRDHSVVARMVELGKLTAAEALTHPARNEITQAIGRHTTIEPSSLVVETAPGDWLIAACDGLSAHVTEAQMIRLLGEARNAQHLASDLVALANRGGGSDNCTVLVLRCRT
jgi:protein phosphatase